MSSANADDPDSGREGHQPGLLAQIQGVARVCRPVGHAIEDSATDYCLRVIEQSMLKPMDDPVCARM